MPRVSSDTLCLVLLSVSVVGCSDMPPGRAGSSRLSTGTPPPRVLSSIPVGEVAGVAPVGSASFGFEPAGAESVGRAAPSVAPVALQSAAANVDAREPSPTEYSEWLQVRGNRFRLYGSPRLDMIFTDSRLVPNNQFPFWVFSEDSAVQNENDEEFDIHPRLTRLGVDIERDSIPLIPSARIAGKIELDFQNGGSESREAVRMRHAYLKVVDESGFSVLAGQTWDLIAPLYPSVNSDGLMWNAGNLGDRRPQLRLGYDTKVTETGSVNVAFALARQGAINNRDLDGDGTSDGIDSAVPMLQARVGVSDMFSGIVTAGVWGHMGWEETDSGGGPEDEYRSRSVGLDIKFAVTDRLTFAGELWYGENLDDVRGGIGQGIDTTHADEITSRGGWAELRYKVTEWYMPAIGYTLDDPRNSDLDPASTTGGGPREKNQAIYFSNHFNLGGGLGVGLEYIYWKTWYQGLDSGDANRVNLWFAYAF